MTRQEVDQAFKAIHKVLDPLTRGQGKDVEAARVAVQSLYLLRQVARREVPPVSRVRTRKPRQ